MEEESIRVLERMNFYFERMQTILSLLETIQRRDDFTGSEPKYLSLKEDLKLVNEFLEKEREFFNKLKQPSRQGAYDSDERLDKCFKDVAQSLKEVALFRREINEALGQQDSSQSSTDAVLGAAELARLESAGMIADAPVMNDEDAFWSEMIQKEADAISDEAAFIAFITPFFDDILATCDMVFINSERYPWLPQSPITSKKHFNLKPDGFATHRGMYLRKGAPIDSVSRANNFRFGKAVRELFDCAILFECKVTISPASSLGQMVRYMQNLPTSCAVLFDQRHFWLIESDHRVVTKIVKAEWTKKGSKLLFRNFVDANKSPWIERLRDACYHSNVDVSEGDAFLGSGAYGRVFKVVRREEVFALKVVDTDNVDRLHQELNALKNAQDTRLTIRAAGECIEVPNGAALLLSPVGSPLPRPTTFSEVSILFNLLWQLHEMDLVHGDPRVPNVIFYRGKPLWIDLVAARQASPLMRALDASILTRSILHVSRESLDEEFEQLCEEYGQSSTLENLSNLISQVWRKLEIR